MAENLLRDMIILYEFASKVLVFSRVLLGSCPYWVDPLRI